MAITFDLRIDMNTEGFAAITTDFAFENDLRNRWQSNLDYGFPNRYRISNLRAIAGSGSIFYTITDRSLGLADNPLESAETAAAVFTISLSESKFAFSGNRQVLGSLLAPAVVVLIFIIGAVLISAIWGAVELSREANKRKVIDLCAAGKLPTNQCDSFFANAFREEGIFDQIRGILITVLAVVGGVAVLSVAVPWIRDQVQKRAKNGK